MNSVLKDSLNKVDLRVTVEVCKISLSLDRLLNLQIGDVIEINAIPAAVKLVVNNQPIAEGFLVKLNGKSGVRIIKLYQEPLVNE